METYWISGVQLGMLLAFAKNQMPNEADDLIEEIIEEQIVSNEVRKDVKK